MRQESQAWFEAWISKNHFGCCIESKRRQMWSEWGRSMSWQKAFLRPRTNGALNHCFSNRGGAQWRHYGYTLDPWYPEVCGFKKITTGKQPGMLRRIHRGQYCTVNDYIIVFLWPPWQSMAAWETHSHSSGGEKSEVRVLAELFSVHSSGVFPVLSPSSWWSSASCSYLACGCGIPSLLPTSHWRSAIQVLTRPDPA
jgi:hypothetical protein